MLINAQTIMFIKKLVSVFQRQNSYLHPTYIVGLRTNGGCYRLNSRIPIISGL